MSKHADSLIKSPFAKDIKQEATRVGFGRGLLNAGEKSDDVWALCADLTESTNMNKFAEKFPERYVEVGVAEQNLVTVASGIAAMEKIPFCSSYAAFCPGRDWEQIRTTIALNERPVKIVGSHAGISVGPDGATHQMLEDIALMRSLPNMVVVAPGDSGEAERATMAMAEDTVNAGYLRLARADSAVFLSQDAPFEIGRAYVLREGSDVTLLGTGIMTYQLLIAAEELSKNKIEAEVVHVPTIKPLDQTTILASVEKTGIAVSAEEGQIAAGFGGAIAELLSEYRPTSLKRLGIEDRFGESGEPEELLDFFGLSGAKMAKTIEKFMKESKS